MFRDQYQAGFINLFYAVGTKPLANWDPHVENGSIKRIIDPDLNSCCIEMISSNANSSYITCPRDPDQELGIKMPYLVFYVKNIDKYFSFEIQIIDDMKIKRRFRACNYQTKACVKNSICLLPMHLDPGWNEIYFNLADFTKRAYGTNYIETLHVTVFANCRLRGIYFSDKLYSGKELPEEYRLIVRDERV